MKNGIVLFFLISIFFQTFGRSIIYFHFLANQKQIAEEQCINKIKEVTICYGNCVLEKKLEITKEKNKKEALPLALKSIKQFILFFNNSIQNTTSIVFTKINQYVAFGNGNICPAFKSEIYHPPSFVS